MTDHSGWHNWLISNHAVAISQTCVICHFEDSIQLNSLLNNHWIQLTILNLYFKISHDSIQDSKKFNFSKTTQLSTPKTMGQFDSRFDSSFGSLLSRVSQNHNWHSAHTVFVQHWVNPAPNHGYIVIYSIYIHIQMQGSQHSVAS